MGDRAPRRATPRSSIQRQERNVPGLARLDPASEGFDAVLRRAANRASLPAFSAAFVGVGRALALPRRRGFEKQSHDLREEREWYLFLADAHELERLGRHVKCVAERVDSAADLYGPPQRHHGDFGIFHPP